MCWRSRLMVRLSWKCCYIKHITDDTDDVAGLRRPSGVRNSVGKSSWCGTLIQCCSLLLMALLLRLRLICTCRPLMSTLAGLVMSNIGLISPIAVEYSIVNKYLLTMAVPLLLFSADLRWASCFQQCCSSSCVKSQKAAPRHKQWIVCAWPSLLI